MFKKGKFSSPQKLTFMTSCGVIPGKCLPWARLTCHKVHHIIVEYSIKYNGYKVFTHHNDWTFFEINKMLIYLIQVWSRRYFHSSTLCPQGNATTPHKQQIARYFSQMLFLQVTYSHYKAIFLPSSDISTALLLAKASLFLSAAARMCLQ